MKKFNNIELIKSTDIIFGIILLIAIVTLFSPLISYTLCIIAFWLYGSSMAPRERSITAILFSISFALIICSRSYALRETDDFANYYDDYINIALNSATFSQILKEYSLGLEFGLPLLFYILSVIFPILTPAQLLFFLSFFVSLLFSFWLIKYGCIEFEKTNDTGFIIALSLTLFSLSIGSQLIRQGFSSVILLYALSLNRIDARYGLLLVSTAFHLTAFPLFVIIRLLIRYGWKAHIALTPLVFFAFLSFNLVLTAFQDFPKFAYYAGTELGEISDTDIGTLKWLLIGVLFSALGVFTSRKIFISIDKKALGGLPFVFFFVILFICFMQYPLLPTRITMLFSLILLGYFTAIFVLKSRLYFLKPLSLFSLLFFKLYTFFPDPTSDDRFLWSNYDWIGIMPGYYLINY